MDDHSTDDTARVAADAGARVLAVDDVLPELGPGEGKGEALYKSVAAAAGRPHRLVRRRHPRLRPPLRGGPASGPLLTRSDISFVKGFYDRPGRRQPPRRRAGHRADGPAGDRRACSPTWPRSCSRCRASTPAGGRCSSGCRSCRATASTSGCSIDIAEVEGTEAIAQVDLGLRRHRNRSLDELGPAGAGRAPDGPRPRRRRARPRPATLVRPDLEPVEVRADERPALVDVSGYRRRTA